MAALDPWWVRHGDILEAEISALQNAGMSPEITKQDELSGQLEVSISLTVCA